MRAARVVTTLTQAQADRIRQVIPEGDAPIHVIPHAVDVGDADGTRGRRGESFRFVRRIPAAAPLVVHVAGIRPEKGYPEVWTLVDALRGVLPDLRYVHAGPVLDPALAAPADAWFAGRPWAIRLGGAPRELVLDAIAAATCTLHASTVEGLSNALLESMALGVPPVARSIPAAEEVISDGADGVLFREDSEAVAVIARLHGDAATRDRLSRAARETAATRYSVSSERGGYLRAYGEAITRARTSSVASA